VTDVVHVESGSRWDTLALTRRLSGYRWYLVEPSERRWEVRVAVDERRRGIPPELRRRIAEWLEERRLPPATIRAGGASYTVEPPATPQ
jgi:hypothetical protein